jgi:hypothetical protein
MPRRKIGDDVKGRKDDDLLPVPFNQRTSIFLRCLTVFMPIISSFFSNEMKMIRFITSTYLVTFLFRIDHLGCILRANLNKKINNIVGSDASRSSI